jgi:transcriptional regulator with XRE-family HTH domain
MKQRHWISFGERIEDALTALGLSYGAAAAEIGVSKASFYRACRGHVPGADNYVKIMQWLKNSQRRIGRKRVAAAARPATRRSKDETAPHPRRRAGEAARGS